MSAIEVRPLSPRRIDDFLAFFDGAAFADNPWWSGCYCRFYHVMDADRVPDPATPQFAEYRARNRDIQIARIRAGAHGHLAYRDGRVVGWVNAAPSDAYENPRAFAQAFRDAPAATGMLMCFVVAPAERDKGVATALLNAACEGFRADGLRHTQSFARRPEQPLAEWRSREMADYHGPLSMYEANGFTKVADLGHYAVMRKAL